jgi:tRNA pseudouridine55 synthase
VYASKELYVRTLSYDIGKKCGYPAYNYELHRVKAGIFDIKDAYTFDDLENNNYSFISLSDSLPNMQTIILNERIQHHVKNGMAISLREFKEPVMTKIIDQNNTLLAIYDKHPEEPKMKALSVFHQE